jgi:hypothetical protein
LDSNATRLPSGDHVGFESLAALRVSRVSAVPFALIVKISLLPPFSREWKTILLAEAASWAEFAVPVKAITVTAAERPSTAMRKAVADIPSLLASIWTIRRYDRSVSDS